MSDQGGRPLLTFAPFLAILVLTLALAAAPQWFRLPAPVDTPALVHATFSLDGRSEQPVTLPHRWPDTVGFGPARGTYRINVDLPSAKPLYLLIPAAQHAITVRFDGRRLYGGESQPWSEPAVGSTYMLRLPLTGAESGVLEVTLYRESGGIPGYLSQLYLAEETAFEDARWLWTLASGPSRATMIGLQVLMVLGIATVWLARRHDPIFAWLFLVSGASLAYTLAGSSLPTFVPAGGQPYIVFALSSFGPMVLGLAMSIVGMARPMWLKTSIIALPAALIAGFALGVLAPLTLATIGAFVAIGGNLAGGVMLARNSLRTREWDQALLAAPFLLVGWYGLRDVGIIVGAVDGALLLGSKTRPLITAAVLVLLMRRLAHSLGELDRGNETLRHKLAAREAELSALHAKERAHTAQAAREDERERLMRDLHDGLSGHLVSIIALSESDTGNPQAIERAARAALDDLRLVVNSLDLDDGDLLPALAGLRERLEPQLRRLGFELDWSMENLPPVSGVTPGNALSILRILQEGITNALKHGASRRIAVEGSGAGAGQAVLSIRNGARDQPAMGKGHGVGNMKRRAEALGGSISFTIMGGDALLTVVLPTHLADC
ncbi:sensor histidine kinase [Mesorhizobium sp. 1B3]|uniref:sensor histidine kinase n=1 Tax=Mesorhizobium sp. 1B3 TaxID=3243599 RepID=UPI003D963B7F